MKSITQAPLEDIHRDMINGNRRDEVKRINEYGAYDFFQDYLEYLKNLYVLPEDTLENFRDVVVSYHRIMNR